MNPLKMATSAVVWCMAMLTTLFQGICIYALSTPGPILTQDFSIDSNTICRAFSYHSCVAGYCHSICMQTFYTGEGGTIRGPKKWSDQQQNILNARAFRFTGLLVSYGPLNSGLKVHVQSGQLTHFFGHSSSPFQRLYPPPPPPPTSTCTATPRPHNAMFA